jgi:RNA binding exosome subunit
MSGAPNLCPSSFPSKYPIGYIEIRVFSHATEDQAKVETALRNILPETLAEEVTFTKTNCIGHHGNPIVLVEAKLADRATLLSVLEKIGSALGILDKEELSTEVNQHIEKHNLYLRLDKQSAFLGKVKFSSTDPIHFKVHFKNKNPQQIADLCRQAGLLP